MRGPEASIQSAVSKGEDARSVVVINIHNGFLLLAKVVTKLYDSIARHMSIFRGTVDRWKISQRAHILVKLNLMYPALMFISVSSLKPVFLSMSIVAL